MEGDSEISGAFGAQSLYQHCGLGVAWLGLWFSHFVDCAELAHHRAAPLAGVALARYVLGR